MKSRDGRAGFSLPELLLVVVIIGILVALASPKLRGAWFRTEVINARNAMANLYTTARLTALQTGRTVTFQRVGNLVLITANPRLVEVSGSTIDTVGAVVDLNDRYGVTVGGTAPSVTVYPKGLGGVAFEWTVTRAEFADTLEVSAFGRILN
jgi:prepilin-type N-terminal cleavage/methylation domain-containing protein